MGAWRPASSPGPTPQSTKANLGLRTSQAARPDHLHGKEGVSGSSPEEGSAKAPQVGAFRSAGLAAERTCGGYGALCGAFRSRSPCRITRISPVSQGQHLFAASLLAKDD
jgi:hypothetical protein